MVSKERLRSPIKYIGGKGRMVTKIVPVLERILHDSYVEPFGGGGSILLAKNPCPIEVYNDLDTILYNFFTVLSDPELFEQFKRRVEAAPLSRQLHQESVAAYQNEKDKVEQAVQWFIVARQCYGGITNDAKNSWGFARTTLTSRRLAAPISGWLSTIKMLPEIHTRLQRVQIENYDFRKVFDLYDTPDTLFYVDPPYVFSPAEDKKPFYRHTLSDDNHREMVNILLRLQGKCVLSGNQNDIYIPLEEAGWRRRDLKAFTTIGGTKGLRTLCPGERDFSRAECLWVKPYEVTGLRPLFPSLA